MFGNGDDVITVPASGTDYGLQIPGESENLGLTGDLDITSNLTISGAGTSATVIDGNDLDRVFDVIGANTVEIRDLTVTGGKTRLGSQSAAGGRPRRQGSTAWVRRDLTAPRRRHLQRSEPHPHARERSGQRRR